MPSGGSKSNSEEYYSIARVAPLRYRNSAVSFGHCFPSLINAPAKFESKPPGCQWRATHGLRLLSGFLPFRSQPIFLAGDANAMRVHIRRFTSRRSHTILFPRSKDQSAFEEVTCGLVMDACSNRFSNNELPFFGIRGAVGGGLKRLPKLRSAECPSRENGRSDGADVGDRQPM
jgi:hypothetical protein